MPANAQFTINDGATTPVAHVFSPTSIDAQGVALWNERNGTVLIGQNQVTYSVRAQGANGAGPTSKITIKLKKPKVVIATGSNGVQNTLVDYTDLATVEFVVSNKGTQQERKDLRVLVANLLQHATFVAAIESPEAFW